MNVLLVSNSFIICEALESIFKNVLNTKSIRKISSLEEATEKDLKYIDLTFVDISYSEKDELKLIQKIKNTYTNVKFMILDLAKNKEIFKKAIYLGVEGYILDINDKEEFTYYINSISKGKKLYSSDMIKYLIEYNDRDEQKLLTNREKEVMILVSRGYKNKDIAKDLYISEYTIKKHVSSILNKLDLRNRKDIIIYIKENERICP